MRLIVLALLVTTACGGKTVGDGTYTDVPEVGWVAEIENLHHNTGGTATIIDETTIEVTDFTYDGGGLNSRLSLVWDGEPYHDTFQLTDNLVGDEQNGTTLTLTIPEGPRFDEWNLITLWCVPANVSFGHGVFRPPQE